MKPSFLIALLLSISSLSTAAMLFWTENPKSSSKRTTAPSSVEIRWGEGSEAGAPEGAIQR